MILIVIIFLPTVLGILNYLLHSTYAKGLILAIQGLMMLLTGYFFFIEDIQHSAPFVHHLGGYAAGIGISLLADPISALLLLVTSVIFFALLLYDLNRPYMTPHFMFLLFVLQTLIYGLFLVQDLFSIYAIIEVSTIVVSVLIMYHKDMKAIYDGLVYLLVNIIAMTFFLLGIGMIYKIFGTLSLLELRTLVPLATREQLIVPYALLMTGISTKVLFLPVFGWLTKAHVTDSAPYTVSALLSGLFIKTGIYLFIRLQGIFGDTMGTNRLFLYIAFGTAIFAALMALVQEDMKHLLAYSTVSQVSLILFGISLDTQYAYFGAIYHIINHSLFKTLLFLCVGLVIDAYGTRKINEVRGILRTMPSVGMAMLLALLGITGAPFFNGSMSKYLIQQGIGLTWGDWLIVVMNLMTLAYGWRLGQMLLGKSEVQITVEKGKKALLITLGILCFLGGFLGQQLVRQFFELEISWTWQDYVSKGLIYIASLLVVPLLFKLTYGSRKFTFLVREMELTFNELIFGVVCFFFGLIGYLQQGII